MRLGDAKIISNTESGPYMLLSLDAPDVAEIARPGQFVMLQVCEPPDPLLRRPFGIHNVFFDNDSASKPSGIHVLYQIVKRGTGILSKAAPGQRISVLGPLGNGFTGCQTKRAFLVAGGIGLAPLAFLAADLKQRGCRVSLMIGARTKELLYLEALPDADEVIIATDDGSEGIKGPVTSALETHLDEDSSGVTVYASGPTPMLERVADLASLYGTPCQLSLEARMACGTGVCHGCAVRALTDDQGETYLRVCKDGPVFDSNAILFQ